MGLDDVQISKANPDTIKPSTSATRSVEPNEAGWNKENVAVTLNATDNEGGSGVEKITYSASGAQSIAQTDAPGDSVEVALAQEGTTTLTYYATDKAGNVEDKKTLQVKIDKSAPTGTVSINDGDSRTSSRSVTLTLSATDTSPGSGVTQMRVSNTQSGLSSASWNDYSTTMAWTLTSGKGTKTVYVQTIRELLRARLGRNPQPSAGIVDSQSAKTSGVGGEARGYDGGKEVQGRKRQLLVDTEGLVLKAKAHSGRFPTRTG